jgi:hypothetical protein
MGRTNPDIAKAGGWWAVPTLRVFLDPGRFEYETRGRVGWALPTKSIKCPIPGNKALIQLFPNAHSDLLDFLHLFFMQHWG